MFLMMSGFVFEGYGQDDIPCQHIELHVDAADIGCSITRLSVWFEYVGDINPSPSSFPLCVVQSGAINPELNMKLTFADAVIEEGSAQFLTVDPDYFTSVMYTLEDNSCRLLVYNLGDEMTFHFGTAAQPRRLFYIDVVAGDNVPFSLDLEWNENNPFSPDHGCSLPVCNTSYSFNYASGVSVEPCTAAENVDELEFFVDTDPADVLFNPVTNETTVTVKARIDNTSGLTFFLLDRLTFSISLADVFGNLEMDDNLFIPGDFDVTEADILLTQNGNTFTYDAKPSDDAEQGRAKFQITNTGVANECSLFTIKIKAPTEPYAAGLVNFEFDYIRTDLAFPDACCAPPSVSSSLALSDYNEPCDDSVFGLSVGASFNTDCDQSFTAVYPVALQPTGTNLTTTLEFTKMDIEIDLDVTGNVVIDATATLNSLHANFPSGSLTISPNSHTIVIHFSVPTGVSISTGDVLFEMHVSGTGMNSVNDIYVKHSDYSWGAFLNTTPCVAPLDEVYENADDVLVNCTGQHGYIEDTNGEVMKNLKVCLYTSPNDANPIEEMTNSNGNYEIDYCHAISPAIVEVCDDLDDDLDDDYGYGNGVTTQDIVLVSKHILAIQPLDDNDNGNGWRWVAADVNKSGTITTADLIQMRKLILGVIVAFENNTSWVFVEKTFDLEKLFTEELSLSDINYSHNNLASNNCDLGFTGIKIGDVNNSHTLDFKEDEPNDKLLVHVVDKGLNANGELEIGFVPENFTSIVGFEMAIKQDPLMLLYTNWQEKDLSDVDTDMFYDKNGTLRIAWYDKSTNGKYLTPTKEMFRLQYNPQAPIVYSINDISLDNDVIFARAYRSDGKVYDIELVYDTGGKNFIGDNSKGKGQTIKENTLSVINREEITWANVVLDEAQTVEIAIFDIHGRLLFNQKESLAKGENWIDLPVSKNWPTGIYVIQMNTTSGALAAKWLK